MFLIINQTRPAHEENVFKELFNQKVLSPIKSEIRQKKLFQSKKLLFEKLFVRLWYDSESDISNLLATELIIPDTLLKRWKQFCNLLRSVMTSLTSFSNSYSEIIALIEARALLRLISSPLRAFVNILDLTVPTGQFVPTAIYS